MSDAAAPVVMLSGKKFVMACVIVACLLLALGRVVTLPVSLLATEVFATILGLFIFGSFRYQIHKNALTYGMALVIVATFVGLETSEWHRQVAETGWMTWMQQHVLSFHGLDDLIHADTMLFILGLTFFVAVIAQTRMLEPTLPVLAFRIIEKERVERQIGERRKSGRLRHQLRAADRKVADVGEKPDGAVLPYRLAESYRKVGIVIEYVARTIGGQNVQTQSRSMFFEFGEARDQPIGGEGGRHGEPQLALDRLAIESGDRIAELVQCRIGSGQKLESALGQRQAVAGTGKEGKAQMALKIGDVLGDGAMGHRKLVGRLAQMQMPGGRLEGADRVERWEAALADFHISELFSLMVHGKVGCVQRGAGL